MKCKCKGNCICRNNYELAVLEGRALIVAHNASFDMNFLANTLERLGFSGNLYYIDTLDLARTYLKLPNNKQTTIAEYFNIPIGNVHRAGDDALVCGKILTNIITYFYPINRRT